MAKVGVKRKSVTAGDIARVGPGTPGGEWFRRYWVVVGTAQELYDLPQAVKGSVTDCDLNVRDADRAPKKRGAPEDPGHDRERTGPAWERESAPPA